MLKIKKAFIFKILVSIFILVLITGGFLFIKDYYQNQEKKWMEYTNEKYNYTFKYPNGLEQNIKSKLPEVLLLVSKGQESQNLSINVRPIFEEWQVDFYFTSIEEWLDIYSNEGYEKIKDIILNGQPATIVGFRERENYAESMRYYTIICIYNEYLYEIGYRNFSTEELDKLINNFKFTE